VEITYVGPYRAVEFEGVVCENGEAVVFPDAIALPALEQDCWLAAPDHTIDDEDTT
jgi:hypothetical protein